MRRTPSSDSRPFFAVLGLVLLLAAGCENLVRPQYRFAEVRVRIRDTAGEPVPDVPVVLYVGAGVRGEGRTGSNGEHLFREVAAGGYGVAINVPPGYILGPGQLPSVDTLTIEQGARREVSFVLRRVP
jgi:hypothetical protein